MYQMGSWRTATATTCISMRSFTRVVGSALADVCNVAGQPVADSISDWVQQHWQVQPQFAQSQTYAAGVQNSYAEPQRLGVDRWLALLGAWQIQQSSCCIVDCGTAMTIDVLDDQGQHQGGLIVPGLMTMQTLARDTGDLAQYQSGIVVIDELPLLAKESRQAIQLGAFYALIGCINYVRQQWEKPLPLLVCGGHAEILLPLLTQPYQHHDDLVLQGLRASLQSDRQ